jgi:predicted cobalt transporter CbtA
MPGSPLAASLDSAQWTTIWTVVITAVGVALLGLLGIPLKDKVT